MSILIAKDLVKIYEGRNIVDNISLHVKSREVVGLLGPKNSGKTTVCYMLIGTVPISKGKIILNKNDINMLSLYNRNQLGVGYLPKEPSIFRNLNVYNNIFSILQIRNDIQEGKHHIYANNLIKELHIEHLISNMGKELFGINRKIVEIARTLAANPKFIIIDNHLQILIKLQ
ncbi:ATP-binding cassette domain-containing protein [Candidatus Pantoea edessiphila]|nr:ATP-binding cassette domain-containing protein [Candidatus Pantoea edessiphila]